MIFLKKKTHLNQGIEWKERKMRWHPELHLKPYLRVSLEQGKNESQCLQAEPRQHGVKPVTGSPTNIHVLAFGCPNLESVSSTHDLAHGRHLTYLLIVDCWWNCLKQLALQCVLWWTWWALGQLHRVRRKAVSPWNLILREDSISRTWQKPLMDLSDPCLLSHSHQKKKKKLTFSSASSTIIHVSSLMFLCSSAN